MTYLTQEFCKKIQKRCVATSCKLLIEINNLKAQDENINVYTRCEALMNPGRPLGFSYNAVKQVITGEHKKDVMIVDYVQLASQPESTIKNIYNFIGEQHYQHDFDSRVAF
jgi:sulfotransferase